MNSRQRVFQTARKGMAFTNILNKVNYLKYANNLLPICCFCWICSHLPLTSGTAGLIYNLLPCWHAARNHILTLTTRQMKPGIVNTVSFWSEMVFKYILFPPSHYAMKLTGTASLIKIVNVRRTGDPPKGQASVSSELVRLVGAPVKQSLHSGSSSQERAPWTSRFWSIVMADASCQLQTAWVTIVHFSLLVLSFLLKSCSYSWRSQCLGSIIWQADAYSSGQKCFSWISADRVQRGKHALLDGLWGAKTRVQQKRHWRKSKANLRRLYFHPFSKRGALPSPPHSLMLLCAVSSNTCLKLQRYNFSPSTFPCHQVETWGVGRESQTMVEARRSKLLTPAVWILLPCYPSTWTLVWGLIYRSLLHNFMCGTEQFLIPVH